LEFATAAQEAAKYGAQVILGDINDGGMKKKREEERERERKKKRKRGERKRSRGSGRERRGRERREGIRSSEVQRTSHIGRYK